jgi:hypothetical protein
MSCVSYRLRLLVWSWLGRERLLFERAELRPLA